MRQSTRGQVVIPALAMIFVLAMLSLHFIQWGRRTLWQMRMDVAADAAALSASRAQAEMLNTISITNFGVNEFIKKARVPLASQQVGEMPAEKLAAFEVWNHALQKLVFGFKTFPAGVGETVARLNGAEGYSPYRPFPMVHYLAPVSLWVAIVSKSPPYAWLKQFERAYYARAWSPGFIKAQPPHKTTWRVSLQGVTSMASARLWLDVSTRSPLANGGFPRVAESWIRDVMIQAFYPQFNARLSPAPALWEGAL